MFDSALLDFTVVAVEDLPLADASLNAAHAPGFGLMLHLWVSKTDRNCDHHVSDSYILLLPLVRASSTATI